MKNLVLKNQAKEISNIRNNPLAICNNLLGVRPWPVQTEIINELYSNPNLRELIICAGRRSSKSFLAAMLAHIETIKWLMLPDPWAHYKIHKGVEVYGIFVGPKVNQTRDYLFMFYKTILKGSWYYKGVDVDIDDLALSIKFRGKGLTVKVESSQASTEVGGSFLFAVMDEVAGFVLTTGLRSGDEIHAALSKGLRYPLNGLLIAISKPLYTKDKIMRLLVDAQKDAQIAAQRDRPRRLLAYHRPTWAMNPDITRASLQDEYDRDPEMADREWGANPSHSIQPYFREPDKIDQVRSSRRNPTISDTGEIEGLKKVEGAKYYLHGDPAFKNDAFGLAVDHLEQNKVVVDLVHRFLPDPTKEIDTRLVRNTIINIHRIVKLKKATFDTWNYPETVQVLKDMGITVELLVIKKEQYDCLKERIYKGSEAIEIPTHEFPVKDPMMPKTVFEELKELELKKGKKVDHLPSGSKDVADAVAGAVWGAYTNRRTRRFRTPRAGARRY